jgi:hypothetical protein
MIKLTIQLTDDQAGQLDRLRGKRSRSDQVVQLISDGLNKLVPSDSMTPTEALKMIALTGRGSSPVPEDNYPTVAELAPYVPFPFPPPPVQGAGAAYQEQRHAAWRAAWACYMENAGWPWDAIAGQLGYPTVAVAKAAANRHTSRYMEKAAIERRQEMRERVDRVRDWTWEHIESPPYKFTVTGNLIVNPDGSAALDEDIRIRYLDLALKIEERQAKLDGSDPRDAQKIEAGNLDYVTRINELVGLVRENLQGKTIAGEIETPPDPEERAAIQERSREPQEE